MAKVDTSWTARIPGSSVVRRFALSKDRTLVSGLLLIDCHGPTPAAPVLSWAGGWETSSKVIFGPQLSLNPESSSLVTHHCPSETSFEPPSTTFSNTHVHVPSCSSGICSAPVVKPGFHKLVMICDMCVSFLLNSSVSFIGILPGGEESLESFLDDLEIVFQLNAILRVLISKLALQSIQC